MDFLDPKFRKRRKTQLFVGYFLMAILVTMLTGFLVLITKGYGFDTTSRQIVKNGTVFLTSDPSGADIYVNGNSLDSTTNKRLSFPENTYTFSLQKNGYRDWTRKAWVGGSTLRRIVYPKLIPTTLQSDKAVQVPVSISSTIVSTTNKWLAALNTTSLTDIYFIETSQPSKNATIVPISSATTHSFEGATLAFTEWDSADNAVLVKAEYTDNTLEYFVVNRKEKTAASLNSLSGLVNYQAKFKGDDYRKIYVLNNLNGELSVIDTDSGIKNILVASDVTAFTSGVSDDIAYIVNEASGTGDKTHSLYYKKINEKTVKINDLSCVNGCVLDLFSYAGDSYLYFGSKDNGISVYKDIKIIAQDQKDVAVYDVIAKIKLADTPKIALSPNSQFILVSTSEKVLVVDVAYSETFLIDKSATQITGWADEFRLLYVDAKSQAAISDFDGSNYYLLDVQNTSGQSVKIQTVFSAKLRTMLTLVSGQTVTDIYVTDLR